MSIVTVFWNQVYDTLGGKQNFVSIYFVYKIKLNLLNVFIILRLASIHSTKENNHKSKHTIKKN